MLKIWNLAKKSHFASVLATEAVNANFLHIMMNYIENGIHHQFLKKNVDEISHPTASTTVKFLMIRDIAVLFCGDRNDLLGGFRRGDFNCQPKIHSICAQNVSTSENWLW